MSTEKQIIANQKNAEFSTGPKTESGKSVVSKNAIKHGLLSSESLLAWENSDQLEELSQKIFAQLQPKSELENLLVDRIVSLTWRLKRLGKIETAIFTFKHYTLQLELAEREINSLVKIEQTSFFVPFEEMDTKTIILDEDKYHLATKRAEDIKLQIQSELPRLGRNFIEQVDIFEKLSRYETSIERSLYKALHELQRVQAMRQGAPLSIPLAIDVNGTQSHLE